MVTESVIDVADLSVNFKEKSKNYVEGHIAIEKAQMFKIVHSLLFFIRGLSVRDDEWVKRKRFCYASRISRCTILSVSRVFYKSDRRLAVTKSLCYYIEIDAVQNTRHCLLSVSS